MYKNNTLAMLSVLAVVGCGGSNSSAPSTTGPVVTDKGVPVLNEAKLSLKPLKKVIQESFETHYKNGIYLSAKDDGIRTLFENAQSDSSSQSVASPSSSSTGEFSTTITQEAGVDEADRVKYDGNFLYIANNNGSSMLADFSATTDGAHIRVMQKNADSTMSEVNALKIGDDKKNATISGIYLNGDNLSVMSASYTYYGLAADTGIAANSSIDIWNPGPQKFNVSLYDVSTPSVTNQTSDLTIDGYVISSRRVDNNLIVVSSYSPFIEGLNNYAQSDEEKAKNYSLITSTDINELLPKYTDANGVENNLVTADDCFIPEDATNKDGHGGIVTLTTINLDNPNEMSSVCINSSMQGIYATPGSVYMYGSADQKQSIIHKFAINQQAIDYKASTNFDGHLFGRGESSLRFSEQGEYLRVVTTQFTEDRDDFYEHKLKVFSDTGDKSLSLVAELPNSNQPEKLGKANEDIYAVRYFGSKAFIVTFEQVDPLYVIDLTDNTQPKIESALEIIGYSSYLHPISEGLILGIGQNVDPNQIGELVDNDDGTAESSVVKVDEDKVIEGAKVALFDVSGDASLVKEFVFEGGYTPAEYDYHALTYLAKSDTQHLFALPIETWSSTFDASKGYDVWSSDTKLQLFEVNISGAGGELLNVGAVSPTETKNDNYGGWNDRAIIDGDLIYYVHGPKVWQSQWSNPSASVGPF